MVRRGGSFNHCVLVSKAMVTGGGFCGVGGGLCGGDGEWHGGGGLFTEERARVLVSSPGASTTPSYSSIPSTPSTPPSYSPGPSTPQSYSSRPSRNAECSNCKHLLGKITVLEATV
ncbi:hypothetical protein Tco_1275000 [Tanacetum coccineum]